MKTQLRKFHAFALGLGLAILAFSGLAYADPPSRVARLGYISGAVSFSPAGEDEWVQATINRPLTTGDRVWADEGSRAEMQIGGTAIRVSAGTDLSILNLDDQIAQLQLTQGALNVRVRRLSPGQVIEVDTPNLAFTVRQPGAYRVEVDPDGNATTIVVRSGQGEVYGEGASYVIDSRQPYRFIGTGLQEYQYVASPALDDFDRWSNDRDRIYDNSATARYVSPDVVGYADLDPYGRWESDPSYGHVWVPTRVRAGWAPYHDGHWAWVDPWGWTWVDDEPWGFAVSHYGRWANRRGQWLWVPGPVQTRAYYAPALVAFVGGSNFQISITSGNVGGVAWFPLGPREVYRPAYHVSRGYFENVNRSNTIVNTTIINNYYNTTNVTNVVYANRKVRGAVVAVPATAFVESRPVRREAVRVAEDKFVRRPVAIAPSVAPTERSVRGIAAHGGKPPAKVLERTVVAREAPPAARPNFAAQKQKLATNAGKPLDDQARRELKPALDVARPAVKVIAKNQEPARARPGDEKRGDERKERDERKGPPAPERADAPRPPKQATAPSEVARPPVQATRPPEQRGQADQRDQREQGDQRAKVEAPRKPPQRSQPDVVAPAAPPQVARPPEQRNQRDQREQDANVGEPRRRERNQPDVVAPKAPVQVTRPPEPEQRERRATQPPTLPPRAQVTPPKPEAPPAPSVQPAPQQPPDPAPTVREPNPSRRGVEARSGQPKRAPAEERDQERNGKGRERGENDKQR